MYLDIGGAPFNCSRSSRPRCIEMLSNSPEFLKAKYSSVWRSLTVGFRHNLSKRLEPTTETLLKAIAALAIHGASMNPIVLKAPAASGMPAKCRHVTFEVASTFTIT